MPYTTWQEFTSGGRPQGGSIVEDLQDFIANVSAKDVPLLAGLEQRGVATAFVEWQEDVLPGRGHNAVLEGIAYTEYGVSMPVRRFAHVQTFYESGAVSDTERQVEHAGFDDALSYAEQKAFLSMRNDMEHALHRGSAATGATSAARQFAGLLNVITTNTTDGSGLTMTESVFNDMLELIWQTGEINPTEVYVNSRLKRTISGYTTNVTRNIDAADKRQIQATDFYDSDFGTLRMYLSRDQLRSATVGAKGNSICVIDPMYFRTGWLQTARREILPRDGLRDRFQMSASMCLMARTEKAGASITDCVANV